jgi:hypothetical protein
VAEGFTLVGDTAQTIAKGVVFSFERAKDLLWQHFLHQQPLLAPAAPAPAADSGNDDSAATAAVEGGAARAPTPTQRQQQPVVASSNSSIAPGSSSSSSSRGAPNSLCFKLFHLAENYRTHQAIVDLAHLGTIEPLLTLFPGALDKLTPETAQTAGELPKLVMPDGSSSIAGAAEGVAHGPHPLQLLFDGGSGTTTTAATTTTSSSSSSFSRTSSSNLPGAVSVQFGADQAVLVAAEGDKAEVKQLLGEDVLVLTVQESKGLEFKVRQAYRPCCACKHTPQA